MNSTARDRRGPDQTAVDQDEFEPEQHAGDEPRRERAVALEQRMPRARAHAATSTVAMAERAADWMSGGMSWIASLIATWLKPQLRHSTTVIAIATASSGREVCGNVRLFQFQTASLSAQADDPVIACSSLRHARRLRRLDDRLLRGALLLPAMRADAGDLDHRRLRREAGGARRRPSALSATAAAGASPTAPQCSQIRNTTRSLGAVIVHAGDEGVAALDAMHEAVVAQEIERAIDRDRRRAAGRAEPRP